MSSVLLTNRLMKRKRPKEMFVQWKSRRCIQRQEKFKVGGCYIATLLHKPIETPSAGGDTECV